MVNCENSLYNIEASAGDAEDVRLTLEHVLANFAAERFYFEDV